LLPGVCRVSRDDLRFPVLRGTPIPKPAVGCFKKTTCPKRYTFEETEDRGNVKEYVGL
jgi:hypothetical protein